MLLLHHLWVQLICSFPPALPLAESPCLWSFTHFTRYQTNIRLKKMQPTPDILQSKFKLDTLHAAEEHQRKMVWLGSSSPSPKPLSGLDFVLHHTLQHRLSSAGRGAGTLQHPRQPLTCCCRGFCSHFSNAAFGGRSYFGCR